MKERAIEKFSKAKARQNENFRKVERKKDRIARWSLREHSPKQREKERHSERKSKKKARQNVEKRNHEKEKDKLARQKLRSDKEKRNQEKQLQREYKQKKRKLSEYSENEEATRKKRKYGEELNKCINKFHENISIGPVYVCTVCHQTWFRHSVSYAKTLRERCQPETIKKYFTSYISENAEWVCHTCKESILIGKTPKLSVANKVSFPSKPTELNLHQMEERLIALRIPFMQIRELPRGGQHSIKGNVVNVPVDIQPTVQALPRQLDKDITVPIKLKRKLSYKSCAFKENVRPLHVISALHWLMQNSDMYKDSEVSIDQEWIEQITKASEEIVNEFVSGATLSDKSTDGDGEPDRKDTEPVQNVNDFIQRYASRSASTVSDYGADCKDTEPVENVNDFIQKSASQSASTVI